MKKGKRMGLSFIMAGLLSISFMSQAEASGTYKISGKHETKPIKVMNVTLSESTLPTALSDVSGYANMYGDAYAPSSHASSVYLPTVKMAVEGFYGSFRKEGIKTENLFAPNMKIYSIKEVVPGILGYTYGSLNTVFLFSSDRVVWNQSLTTTSVYHELGHVLQTRFFTEQDMKTYMAFRGIPKTWTDDSSNWRARPCEIFAEDFIQLFAKQRHYHGRTLVGDMDANQLRNVKNFILNTIKKKTGTVVSSTTKKALVLK